MLIVFNSKSKFIVTLICYDINNGDGRQHEWSKEMIVLTEERKEQGLSMSALAAKAGMHVSSISQIEGGRLIPYPGQVKKLVKALGWTGEPSKLFMEVDAR